MDSVELAPGYRISRIVKGNWQLAERHGGNFDPGAAIADMRRFVEAGITAFDCADHYAGVEDLIGAFRRENPEHARRIKVHTKIVPDSAILPRIGKSDIAHIVDRARRRLGQERLDLAQFHWWDYDIPGYVEAMAWLAELRREGKIDRIGVTNFDTLRLGEILAAGIEVASNQLQYSAIDRRPERGMVELCRKHRIALQCYGSVAGGFLSERWLGRPDPAPNFANRSLAKYRLIIDEWGSWDLFQELLRTLHAVGRRHDAGIGAVAIRAVLDKPGVATAIVGAPTAAHLASLARIGAIKLTDADRAEIDAVVGRGAGPAGDCYELERVKGGRHGSLNWTNQNLRGVGAP